MTLSKTFPVRRATGLIFPTSLSLPPLGIGTTSATFHLSGKILCFKHLLIKFVNSPNRFRSPYFSVLVFKSLKHKNLLLFRLVFFKNYFTSNLIRPVKSIPNIDIINFNIRLPHVIACSDVCREEGGGNVTCTM